MNFAIVHFNTPELTTCLLSSIKKMHPNNTSVWMFDNSNKNPFPAKLAHRLGVNLIDNTEERVLNFEGTFRKQRLTIDALIKRINNLGSARHALSIDWLINHLPVDDFVLLDSDILLRRPIDFCNSNIITAGEVNYKEKHDKPVRKWRLLPYCQYININLTKQYRIKYFDATRILGFDPLRTRGYDTGSSYYEDVLKCGKPFLYNFSIDLDDYIVHYKGGSWDNTNQKIPYDAWLGYYANLWAR